MFFVDLMKRLFDLNSPLKNALIRCIKNPFLIFTAYLRPSQNRRTLLNYIASQAPKTHESLGH